MFVAGSPIALPFSPNSFVFENSGSNAYLGVDSTKFGTNGLMIFNGSSVFQFTGHLTTVQRFSWGYSAVPSDGFVIYILWLETLFAWGLWMCYQKFIAGRDAASRR